MSRQQLLKQVSSLFKDYFPERADLKYKKIFIQHQDNRTFSLHNF